MTGTNSRRALSRAIKSALHRMGLLRPTAIPNSGGGSGIFPGMEELELRQLLSGTLFKVTLVDESPRTTGSEQMLHLQDGVPTENDPTIVVASQYEERPEGMSTTDFIKSLISGTITGTVYVGDPTQATPVSFQFPQDVGTTAGDTPIVLYHLGGDDANGYSAGIAVDDYFNYENSSSHSYGNDEWTVALEPAGPNQR